MLTNYVKPGQKVELQYVERAIRETGDTLKKYTPVRCMMYSRRIAWKS